MQVKQIPLRQVFIFTQIHKAIIMENLQPDLFGTSIPSKSATLSIVKSLKEAGQDHEFYPSTESQIKAVTDDIQSLLETHDLKSRYKKSIKVLDVGAGDGRVLSSISNALESNSERDMSVNMYAIEKASLHTDTYRGKSITLLGTEFSEINFISKKADVAYTNPPYSDFSNWLVTLITQLNFKLLYVVVPERWKDDAAIQQAIKTRQIVSTKVLTESDFFDADREARAKVQVVRFAFNDFEKEAERAERAASCDNRNHRHYYTPEIGRNATCPFQLFIENELGLKKSYSETTNKFNEHIEKERVRKNMQKEDSQCHQLVVSRGVLWALLDSYERDLGRVLSEYKKISALDPVLLQELGVEYDSLCEGVKDKLFGFRNVYWGLLFEELDTLSSRLTSKHRQSLLNTLAANSLDFTYTNAIYIVSYAVEMANELVEQSLIDVYKNLTSEDAILRHYKSNSHVYKDDWRHTHGSLNDKASYLLDYRFVYSQSWSNFSNDSWKKGLADGARSFVNDLLVVFTLLGYSGIYGDTNYDEIVSGSKLIIHGTEPCGKSVELLKVRFFKNGNRHCSFSQKAMLRFNITVSRLLGWIRNKDDFEFEADVKTPVADEIWRIGDTLKILPSTVLALTDKTAA